MTRLASHEEAQLGLGCMGLIIGGIIFGLLGFAIGLLFLTTIKAIATGILAAITGSILTAITFYKLTSTININKACKPNKIEKYEKYET